MLRRRFTLAAGVAALASCASLQRPPSPEDISAKRFETVPDKAVVYLFRPQPDFIRDGAAIMLDNQLLGTAMRSEFIGARLMRGGVIIRLSRAPGTTPCQPTSKRCWH